MNDSQDILYVINPDSILSSTQTSGEYVLFEFAIGDIVSINGLKCTVIGQINYGRASVNYLVQSLSGKSFTVHRDNVKRWCDA